MTISVIIPVYNTEKYLEECIESVIKQTYRELEILLVNDGSTDRSRQIAAKYTAKDHRVQLIDKENGGLSDARNCGIRNATGEYIIFLDSDDYWANEKALQGLVRRIRKTKADVLNYSYVKYYEDQGRKIPYFKNISPMPDDCKTKSKQLNYMISNNLYIASACNKLIKRSLFEKYDLFFEKGIFSEDIEWCCRLLKYASTMDFVCANFYMYRQRSGSISHTIDNKKCNDLKNNILKCIDYGKAATLKEQKYIYSYAAYQFGTFFVTQALATEKQHKCIKELEKYKWILKYHGNNKKLIFLYLITKVIGYKATCRILRGYYEIRGYKN